MHCTGGRICWVVAACAGLVIAGGCSAVSPPDMTVAEAGRPVAKIVIAEDANESERAAAEELRTWLAEMIGASPEVGALSQFPAVGAINVGLMSRFGLRERPPRDQEVLVECDGQTLTVAGGGDYGTIYAAIELLRHLGCRKPLYKERVIPKRPTIRLGSFKISRRPAIRYRLLWRKDHWCGRNVMAGPHPFLYSKGHATGNVLVSAKKYFAEHPEWFALRAGKRTPPQVCVSNAAVLDQCVADVETLCEEGRMDVIGLSPSDGHGFCECEACKALGERLSDRVIWFENEVIKRVEKKYPNQLFFTYAYIPYDLPPLHNKPHPKLYVMYAPFVTCQDHPYVPDRSETNARALRNMEGWAKLAPGRMMIFEYGAYNQCAPRPNLFKTAADFPTFQRLGVMYFYRDIGRRNPWTQGINTYADARLCWDPQLTSREIIHDFCSMFGPAQATCEEFYRVQEQAMAATPDVRYNVVKDLPRIYTPDVLAECRRLLNKAIGQGKADPVAARRLGKLNAAFTYTEMRLAQLRAYAAWQADPSQANRDKGRAISERLLRHIKTLGGILDVKRARRYCHEIGEQFSSTIHGIGPGKFSYVDQYDEGNTRIHMDATEQTGCLITGPLLAQRPGERAVLVYDINTQGGCEFTSLELSLWQLPFPGAPNMKIELVVADGKRHVLFDGRLHRKWHSYTVDDKVAGLSSCRLSVTRDNPTDGTQQFLGAFRLSGAVVRNR